MKIKDIYTDPNEEIAELLHEYLKENGIESKLKESHLIIDIEDRGQMVVTVHTIAGPGPKLTIVHTSNITKQGFNGGAIKFDIYDPDSFPKALTMIQDDIAELLNK